MKPGTRGLSAEERQWLRAICMEPSERSEPLLLAPTAVLDSLLSKRLIEFCSPTFIATLGGFAEALRTADPVSLAAES